MEGADSTEGEGSVVAVRPRSYCFRAAPLHAAFDWPEKSVCAIPPHVCMFSRVLALGCLHCQLLRGLRPPAPDVVFTMSAQFCH